MKYNWNKTLHLVRGLPGSGKSTFAKTLVNDYRQVVENDNFFIVQELCEDTGKYIFDEDMRCLAGWWCYAEAFKRIRNYESIAVPNVFARKEQLVGYIEQAGKLEIKVVIHHMKPLTIEDSYSRNTHECSKESIEKMHNDFEIFTQNDCDNILYSMKWKQ